MHCTPEEALRQDYTLVMAVLDYRTAVAARDAFNAKDQKRAFEVLAENPQLLKMLAMMHRAQKGLSLNVPESGARQEGMQVAEAHRTTVEEEG